MRHSEEDLTLMQPQSHHFVCVFLFQISHWLIAYFMGGHSHQQGSGQNEEDESGSTTADKTKDEEQPMEAAPEPKTVKSSARTTDTRSICSTMSQDLEFADPDDMEWGTMMLPCCEVHHATHDEVKERLEGYRKMAREMEQYEEAKEERDICRQAQIPERAINKKKKFAKLKKEEEKRDHNNKIMRMSIKTGLAIAVRKRVTPFLTMVWPSYL